MSELETAPDVTEAPSCPKCAGPMWDNREGKRNPKAPDFKCKNKECDGVIWPPRSATAGGAPAAAGAPAGAAPAGMPSCPICGGAMWDDRASKRNPKAPDFKCRNRPKMKGGPGCEGIIWPPRDGAPSPYPGAPGAAAGGAPGGPAGGAAARPWPGASGGGSGRAPSAPPRDAAPPPDDRDFDPGFGGPDDDDLPF